MPGRSATAEGLPWRSGPTSPTVPRSPRWWRRSRRSWDRWTSSSTMRAPPGTLPSRTWVRLRPRSGGGSWMSTSRVRSYAPGRWRPRCDPGVRARSSTWPPIPPSPARVAPSPTWCRRLRWCRSPAASRGRWRPRCRSTPSRRAGCSPNGSTATCLPTGPERSGPVQCLWYRWRMWSGPLRGW